VGASSLSNIAQLMRKSDTLVDRLERCLIQIRMHAEPLGQRPRSSPAEAVTQANALVTSLMERRGYPVSDFEQRAADISVDHPHVTLNYRTATTIASRLGKSEVGTEDLRAAMIHYHALFDELVQEPVAAKKAA
jgi:hypothetical protein